MRTISYPIAPRVENEDYILLDNRMDGTRRIRASNFNTSNSGGNNSIPDASLTTKGVVNFTNSLEEAFFVKGLSDGSYQEGSGDSPIDKSLLTMSALSIRSALPNISLFDMDGTAITKPYSTAYSGNINFIGDPSTSSANEVTLKYKLDDTFKETGFFSKKISTLLNYFGLANWYIWLPNMNVGIQNGITLPLGTKGKIIGLTNPKYRSSDSANPTIISGKGTESDTNETAQSGRMGSIYSTGSGCVLGYVDANFETRTNLNDIANIPRKNICLNFCVYLMDTSKSIVTSSGMSSSPALNFSGYMGLIHMSPTGIDYTGSFYFLPDDITM